MIRLLLSLSLALSALAAPVATPSFEVKFALLGAALATGAPSPDLSAAFGLEAASKTRSYAYFDTDAKDLHAAGWAVRLRHKAGKDLELTYKKRYATGAGLESALVQAKDEGFDSSDTNYKAEVDWSLGKHTLSFSNEKEVATSLSGTQLPAAADGLKLLLDKIPGKLEDWGKDNWGKDTLKAARQYGPVTSRTWDGEWEGVEVGVEVLTVKAASGSGTELYTEFSFKTDAEEQAASLRAKAQGIIEGKGWLDADGDLKTNLILDRY